MEKSIAKFFAVFAACAMATNASAANGGASADEFSDAYQQFSFDLFDQVEKKYGAEGNVVISPLSAWFALGMLQQGAATTTLTEINQALRLSPNFTDLAPRNQQFTEQLTASPAEWKEWYEDDWKSVLELANSFWADDQITCLDSYKEALHTYYQADYAQLDLQQQESLDQVDAWVNEKTHGTIPSLKIEPNQYMRMLLVNALYFKSTWRDAIFADLETTESPFTTASGEVRMAPMMHAHCRMEYGESDGYKTVRLHLGREQRFSMTFFLGGKEAAAFGPAVYEKANEALRYEDVKLSLPRFTADCNALLNDPLQEMGMREAFTSDADLSRTSSDPLSVSLVKQLTHIAVDEKGVEASAATVVVIEKSEIGPEPEWKELIIDHPFYFSIDDHLTHKTLFLGHIQDIKANDGTSTDNLRSTDQSAPKVIYDMMGHRHSNLSKGLNIINAGGRKKIVYVK